MSQTQSKSNKIDSQTVNSKEERQSNDSQNGFVRKSRSPRSSLKLILGGLLILILMLGVGVGYYLSLQEQDVRQQASEGEGMVISGNLLLNSGFEDGMTGWDDPAGPDDYVVVTPLENYTGVYSLRITGIGQSRLRRTQWVENPGGGEPFTLHACGKRINGTDLSSVAAEEYGADDSYIAYHSVTFDSETWECKELDFITSNDTEKIAVSVFLGENSDNSKIREETEFFVDDIGLVKNDQLPTGAFDYADCTLASGWALDWDDVNKPLQVDFWLEKSQPLNSDLNESTFLGSVVADLSRIDLDVTNTNHGFSYRWTNMSEEAKPVFYGELNGNKPRTVTAFAIDLDDSSKHTKLPVSHINANPLLEDLDENNFPISWFYGHSGEEYWGDSHWCDNAGTVESVTEEKHSGDRAVKVDGVHVPCQLGDQEADSVLQFVQHLPPLTPNQKYQISAWVKPIDMQFKSHIIVKSLEEPRTEWTNNIADYDTQTVLSDLDPQLQEWQQIVIEFTPETVWNKVDIRAERDDSFYVDDILVKPIDDQSVNLYCSSSGEPLPRPTTEPTDPTEPAACDTAADCDDANPCTTDVCLNPGTAEAVCSHQDDDTAICGTHQQCQSGSCSQTCEAGWFNCDDDWANGCEASGTDYDDACTGSQPQADSTLDFSVKLAGVPIKEADRYYHPVTAGQSIKVRVTLLHQNGTVYDPFYVGMNYSEQDGAYHLAEPLELMNVSDGYYNILVKGPKHLQRKFCTNNQKATEVCSAVDLVNDIGLQLGSDINASFNFTATPLPAGDLPIDGVQDGYLDVLDYSVLFNCLSDRDEPACVEQADLNYDGYVSDEDVNLMFDSIRQKSDEI